MVKTKETKQKIYYFVMILNLISKKYDISIGETYKYLNKYKGMEFLQEFYDVEHTLNTEDVLDDVLAICAKNGGYLQWSEKI